MPSEYESTDRILARELVDGERLLWSGRPRAGVRLHRHDLMVVPFSLFWCGFVVFWMIGVARANAPPFFLAFGTLFCVFGLYFLVGRFLYDAWRSGRTVYGLTDHRAIVVSAFGRVDSVVLDDTGPLSLTERGDGTGTIEFGVTVLPIYGFFRGSGMPYVEHYLPPAFEEIEDVRRIYGMVLEGRRVGA